MLSLGYFLGTEFLGFVTVGTWQPKALHYRMCTGKKVNADLAKSLVFCSNVFVLLFLLICQNLYA